MTEKQGVSNNRIIVKVGTTTLTYGNGALNLKKIQKISWVLCDLKNQGKEVILVSSGAIAVGMGRLGLSSRPRDIKGKQAASAVGQAALMQIYENFFMEYNQVVAQILLTKDVFDDEKRRQYAKNTFSELLQMGVIPIVNENDTVAIDEIEFSDNDTLSAYVACLVEGDILILLSDVKGLYDSDPTINESAKLISNVTAISDELIKTAGSSSGNFGTGGMASKIAAAAMTMDCGINMVIASGENPEILFDIIEGKNRGTMFYGCDKIK